MSREAELQRRLSIWKTLLDASPNKDGKGLSARTVNKHKAFFGGRGIWRQKTTTDAISQDSHGITVGVLHTGVHYDDDIDDQGGLYHYPDTKNKGTDWGDIEATKNCRRHQLPLFVVTSPTPEFRDVALGWVTSWDDSQQVFLIEYGASPRPSLPATPEEPFRLLSKKKRTKRLANVRSGQTKFRFLVAQRYGMKCAVSAVNVPEMLEAAHIVPSGLRGPDDPRNGLMLSANLHKAYDAGLWAIDPTNMKVVTKPEGPNHERLGIAVADLHHLPATPAQEALVWKWNKAQKDWK